METNDKIAIHVPPDYNGAPINVNLEVREGQAKGLIDDKDNEQKYKQNVTIQAITEFTSKRKFESDPKNNSALIEFSVNPDSPLIQFYENPEDKTGIELYATLSKNPELNLWKINTENVFTPKELKALIMKTGGLFPEVATAKALIKQLESYQVKVSAEIEKMDDRQGKKTDNFGQVLEFTKGSAPTAIHLRAPLFKNTAPVDLTLEVQIDVVNNLPCYSFYCFELTQQYIDKAKELILEVIEPLKSTFVCLEK